MVIQHLLQVLSFGSLPEHDSFSDAIEVSKALNLEKPDLKGKKIMDYKFDGNRLILVFPNEEGFEISAHFGGVKWKKYPSIPVISNLILAPKIYIKFPNYENNELFTWEWKKILDALINKDICAVSLSETMFFLYVTDAPDLVFSVLIINNSEQKTFLFFDEE
jgi:hypothetical protein